jgi:hypothetical protein
MFLAGAADWLLVDSADGSLQELGDGSAPPASEEWAQSTPH